MLHEAVFACVLSLRQASVVPTTLRRWYLAERKVLLFDGIRELDAEGVLECFGWGCHEEEGS